MEIKEILAKEQFNQKLGLKYFVTSGHFLSVVVFFYLIDLEATTGLIFILAISLLVYKYLFNYTTNGDQTQPLLLSLLAKALTKIRQKAKRKQRDTLYMKSYKRVFRLYYILLRNRKI